MKILKGIGLSILAFIGIILVLVLLPFVCGLEWIITEFFGLLGVMTLIGSMIIIGLIFVFS